MYISDFERKEGKNAFRGFFKNYFQHLYAKFARCTLFHQSTSAPTNTQTPSFPIKKEKCAALSQNEFLNALNTQENAKAFVN